MPGADTGAKDKDPRALFREDQDEPRKETRGRKPKAAAPSKPAPRGAACPHFTRCLAEAPINPVEVEDALEPLTAAISETMKKAEVEPLDEKEASTWRKTAAVVARKYLNIWLLPEILFTVATVALVLRRVRGFKAILSTLGGGAVLFGLLVFLHYKRQAVLHGLDEVDEAPIVEAAAP